MAILTSALRTYREGRAARAQGHLDGTQLGRINRAGVIGGVLASPVADGMAMFYGSLAHSGWEGTTGLAALATGVLTAGGIMAGRAYGYGLPENQPRVAEPAPVEEAAPARRNALQRMRDGFGVSSR